ncbi:Hypothetical protein PHPALM_36296 [Phytophthora palmivora]|uniref:PiggyBac transposable element-derived protein domain-containing protein n=1 Tax=Phytophthora palmivora TaxID=4796 RepID=A0A2P4X0A6_9STRA|nr:Hypothetical protein PHPALM_36296 [Phytophthora palmivora]
MNASYDKAWKIRSIINALTRRFKHGYTPPPTMAFDEAMLPSRSNFNRMRVYMKDKPHKWGTKLFMLCCSSTAYCIRFELYCGKQEHGGLNGALNDYGSGPAAVIRNLCEVFGPNGPGQNAMRLIVTDRYYTSIPLAMQMLTMGFYTVGTVQTNRLGLPVSLLEGEQRGGKKRKPLKRRPVTIERGTFEVADHAHIQGLRAIRWWDNRAVYLLASGGSVELDRVTYMISYVYNVINAYIIFNARRAADGLSKLPHVNFLKQLRLELCQLQEDDWDGLRESDEDTATPSKTRTAPMYRGHTVVLNDEWRPGNNQSGRKRRTRAWDSSIYCSDCKLPTSSKKPKAWRVFLCDKVRHRHNGALMSCFEIWHKAWRNGTILPKKARKRNIRARVPAAETLREELSEGEVELADNVSTDDASPRAKRSRPSETQV